MLDEATFFDQNQTYARALLQWSRAADQGIWMAVLFLLSDIIFINFSIFSLIFNF